MKVENGVKIENTSIKNHVKEKKTWKIAAIEVVILFTKTKRAEKVRFVFVKKIETNSANNLRKKKSASCS